MSQTAARWLDNESQDAVDLFWRSAGAFEDFPRTLERPLALALPVALVKLPRLRLKDVEHWLKARSIPFSFNCQSRAMHGCLVAFAGQGVIFVDGADPCRSTACQYGARGRAFPARPFGPTSTSGCQIWAADSGSFRWPACTHHLRAPDGCPSRGASGRPYRFDRARQCQ